MNILAHYILSNREEEIIVGNFIADFIKGNHIKEFSIGIKKGIDLHRKIDTFSDTHKSVKGTNNLLNEEFGHYGKVITDIYYDHFLCLHWQEYSKYSLEEDIENLYSIIKSYLDILTGDVHRKVSRSIEKRWLYKYKDVDEMHEVFLGMSRRAKFANNFPKATEVLKEKYEEIHGHFCMFFPDIVNYVELLNKKNKL